MHYPVPLLAKSDPLILMSFAVQCSVFRAFAFILIANQSRLFVQVSWVRHRGVHLLTVAMYTYTADLRFRAVHKPYYGDQAIHPDSLDTYQDWMLEIHSVQQRDSGIYECQISTTPHLSLPVHLRVVGESLHYLCG